MIELDDNKKQIIRTIILAFGESDYIEPDVLLIRKVIDCDEKVLLELLMFLKKRGYILFVKGFLAEINLPVLIMRTEKLKNESKELKL